MTSEATHGARTLFRSMKVADDGKPVVEDSGRGLGVRPGYDVLASNGDDQVPPKDGGMSVSPDAIVPAENPSAAGSWWNWQGSGLVDLVRRSRRGPELACRSGRPG